LTNREIEVTNDRSERALHPGAVYRKINNGFRSDWGASFYAELRSIIESERRRCVRAIDAKSLTLQRRCSPS
jgi:transposase